MLYSYCKVHFEMIVFCVGVQIEAKMKIQKCYFFLSVGNTTSSCV